MPGKLGNNHTAHTSLLDLLAEVSGCLNGNTYTLDEQYLPFLLLKYNVILH